ncbi:MAG: SDR family oxidoreductase [Alphaproteobacteria bacterium]|nr:SDR family oxidoreductase [Alphaproteobacteria bacterium]
MQLTGLSGAAFIVSGAGQGIGEGVVRALAAAGARVGLTDINAETLGAVAKSLRAGGATVASAVADMADETQIRRAAAALEKELGPIQGLVNVAGVQRSGRMLEQGVDDFDLHYRINTRAHFIMTQAVAKGMAERRRGAIVTITSITAFTPRVNQGGYCTSKAAVSHLMRVFGLELAPLGVRCNTVAPGSVETDMIRRFAATSGFAEQLLAGSPKDFRLGIPLGKNGQIADIANTILFLLSDQSSHMTMHEVVVDGGMTLGM